MRAIKIIIIILLCEGIRFSSAQDMSLYRPAGFQNPLLKSGQFITSLYYSQFESLYGGPSSAAQDKTKTSKNDIYLSGYIGLTDMITLKADLKISPGQATNESIFITSGKDRVKFNITPRLILSYRPSPNLEIFSDLEFVNYTNHYGDRTSYRQVPVGVDSVSGQIIFDRVLVTTPGMGDIDIESTTIQVGFTWHGNLW